MNEVFAYVSDLTNAPEWQTGLLEVRRKTAMKVEGFSRLAEPLIAASVRREMSAEFAYLKDLLESRTAEFLAT